MSWGADQLGVTEETFSMIKAAVAPTDGIFASTNITGVDLQPLVSLVPVDTPFRNDTPRVQAPQGARYAYWRALLNINQSQSDGAVPFDWSAPLAVEQEQDFFAPFGVIGQGGTVTQDAIAQATNYADALAVGTLQTLNQVMITEDINLLNSISFALPAIATPSLAASATGGTIAASTAVNVKVAARSGKNYYYGGSGVASAQASVTTGSTSSTNSVTATVTAVKLAAAYDWYVDNFYYTTTTVNTVNITFVPTANQPLPTLPLLSTVAPTAPPTADSSYSTSWITGLAGTILGDSSNSSGATSLVTPGTGSSQGAYYQSLDGATFTYSGAAVEQLDAMNEAIYNSYQISPTRYLMGAQSINDLSNILLGSPQAQIFMQVQADGRGTATLGGRATNYINKTTGGTPIMLELQPHLPPGQLIAVTDAIPFPGANISTVLSVETLLDYWRYEYGSSRVPGQVGGGPRYDFEIRCQEAFKNLASPAMGVIANIGAGS